MHGFTKVIAFLAALGLPCAALAQTPPATASTPFIRGVVNAALTDGGDDLVKVQFRNADSEKIKAGGLLMVGGGVLISPQHSPFSVQATLNYHFDTITAKNGDASFDRFPLEAIVFYNWERHRFGIGVSHHLSPEAEFDLDGQSKTSAKFDDVTGIVLEYNFAASPKVWIGIRYTSITYELSDGSSEEFDGDHIGLTGHIPF